MQSAGSWMELSTLVPVGLSEHFFGVPETGGRRTPWDTDRGKWALQRQIQCCTHETLNSTVHHGTSINMRKQDKTKTKF